MLVMSFSLVRPKIYIEFKSGAKINGIMQFNISIHNSQFAACS